MRMAGTVAAPCPQVMVASNDNVRVLLMGRVADYISLTKPRIGVMVFLAVSAGYFLASTGPVAMGPLLQAAIGILAVAGASSALNQWWEQDTDSRMLRTQRRPIPAGRLSSSEVLLFGCGLAVFGVTFLGVMVNGMTAALAAATCFVYSLVYTPLKRHSAICTAIGAVPGAMPPVLGWVAAGGEWNAALGTLFLMLFLWQFPHFLAIGWIYRKQYGEAGLKMLPFGGQAPGAVGLQAVGYALALLPVSVHPAMCGLAGRGYALLALLLGLMYLAGSVRFLMQESTERARQLLWISLIYLPLLLLGLVGDRWLLLS